MLILFIFSCLWFFPGRGPEGEEPTFKSSNLSNLVLLFFCVFFSFFLQKKIMTLIFSHLLAAEIDLNSHDRLRRQGVVTAPGYRNLALALDARSSGRRPFLFLLCSTESCLRAEKWVCHAVVRTLCNPSWPQRTLSTVSSQSLCHVFSNIQQRKLRTVPTPHV